MSTGRFVLYYILIPVGIVLCAVNAVILFTNSRIAAFDLFIACMTVLQILFSVGIVLLDLAFPKKAVPLYIGLLIAFWGLLNAAVYLVPSFGIAEFWPLYVFFAGLLLAFAGFYKYKKLKFGFMILSLTFMGLGGLCLLFSFRIIRMSFWAAAARLGPVFLLLVAVFMTVFFLLQQKHKELIVNDDDTGTFDDEDIPLTKTDD